MAAFPAKVKDTPACVFHPGKFDAPLDQFFDSLRTFGYDETDNLFFTESGAAFERIRDVRFETAFLSVTAAMPPWARLVADSTSSFFVDDGDRPQLGGSDGETQPCDPAADDEKI